LKATGVVRRIDDLGRIVIPIEIRRSMNIRDGDPLEIFVDKDGEVILKKYSAIAELGDFAREIAASIHDACGHLTLLCDRDAVVTVVGGPEKGYLLKKNGPTVMQAMENRETVLCTEAEHKHEGNLVGPGDECEFSSHVIAPIVVAGDPIGCVVVATREEAETVGELEKKLAETAAGFLARHMEE
jgi:stage V sporulation protein T